MRSSWFLDCKDSTHCLVDSWDSPVQPQTVLEVFSDAISGFAATFVMLFGDLLQGMVGAISLSLFGAGLAIRPDNPLQRADAQGFLCSFFPWTLRTLKVRTVSQQVRIGLVGKGDKARPITTSTNEMEHRKDDADSFHHKTTWAMQSAREWNVSRSTRKMCVCARPVRCSVHTSRRVQGNCHCMEAKSRKKTTTNQQLRFLSSWKSVQKNSRRRSAFLVDGDNFWLVVWNRADQVPGACIDFIENASRYCLISEFSDHLSSCQLCWRLPFWAWWPPGRRGWWLLTFFCEMFSPIDAEPLKVPLLWRIKQIM